MKNTRNFFCTAILLAVTVGLANAQVPIPNVPPPIVSLNSPSPFLSDWQSRASTATVLVLNNTGAPFPSKIWVEFILNGTRVAYSQPGKLPVITITNGPNTFNGETLVPMSAVKFESNVDKNSQRAGRIPDGEVCIIVHVQELDPKTSQPTGREAVGKGCSVILSYTPPQLILPGDNSELCKLGNNNVIDKRNGQPVPLFQWTPIVPTPQQPVYYHFAIYEVLPGQSPIAAFQGARAVFETGTGFLPDLINLTDLLWPTQYFLPEKGKMYVWSVRALDPSGNPFVLTNDGWAPPFTFTVPLNCDQSGTGGSLSDILLMAPQVLDFGSLNVGSQSRPLQISLTNTGSSTLSLHPPDIIPPGSNLGFAIDLEPSMLTLDPGVSTSFTVSFKPIAIGMADGSVRIATDGGTAQVELKGQGVDATAPTIKIISPIGGENLPSGSPYTIKFTASDNNALTNYKILLSTDGGTSFINSILPADNSVPQPPAVMWNVPADLQTSQGIIKVTADDKNGYQTSAVSGLFSVGNVSGGVVGNNPNGTSTNPSNGFAGVNTTNNWMFIPLGLELLSPNGTPLNMPTSPDYGNNHGINMTFNGDGHPPLKLHVISMTIADVNNDGMPDLLLLDDSQGKNILYLLLRKQDGTYTYPQAINTGK
jgi:hypothetical protein